MEKEGRKRAIYEVEEGFCPHHLGSNPALMQS